MSHFCHKPGCWLEVSPKMLACKPHWFMLPKHLRDMIWNLYVPGQEITKSPSTKYLLALISCLDFWKQTTATSKQEKDTMAYGQLVSMNRLKDGVIGGFRVSEIKTFQADVEAQNSITGMIEVVKWRKLQVTLTHDASQPMNQKDPYAVAIVDPSHPLVLKLHTFLIPQSDGKLTPAEKAPSSDKMRWAFIKYDTIQKILKYGGYIPKSNPVQRYPLPGTVFIEVALSKGNNYPRDIGGPEIMEEKRTEMDEMSASLDAICGMDSDTTDSSNDLDNVLEEHVTGQSVDLDFKKHSKKS